MNIFIFYSLPRKQLDLEFGEPLALACSSFPHSDTSSIAVLWPLTQPFVGITLSCILLTMTTPKPTQGSGDLNTFNIHHGFAEALLRGMRSSFLGDTDYHHLTQCETLDDVRLNLSESDYADALADFNSLTPNTLQKAAVDKVCNQNCSCWP